MFTGIIKELAAIKALKQKKRLLHYAIECPTSALEGLKVGASVSVNGVCQTVVSIEGNLVWFDAIEETLERTTLRFIREGEQVNIERSVKIGDEVGGHFLSGHIYGIATLTHIKESSYTFCSPPEWMHYLFPKGSIAIDGVSLTLSTIDSQQGAFTIHFIPLTLRTTTLGKKKVGDRVNVELDPLVQAAVHTAERTMLAFCTKKFL